MACTQAPLGPSARGSTRAGGPAKLHAEGCGLREELSSPRRTGECAGRRRGPYLPGYAPRIDIHPVRGWEAIPMASAVADPGAAATWQRDPVSGRMLQRPERKTRGAAFKVDQKEWRLEFQPFVIESTGLVAQQRRFAVPRNTTRCCYAFLRASERLREEPIGRLCTSQGVHRCSGWRTAVCPVIQFIKC
jgi:hypothetical protein